MNGELLHNEGPRWTTEKSDPSGSDPESVRLRKILVVDDVPAILLTVKDILQPHYQVIPVVNYQLTIKALGSTDIDLIIIDINMPEMDGITLAKIIRAMDAHVTTPIIFMTGNSERGSVIASMAAGGNDFLVILVKREVLLRKVQKFLPPEPRDRPGRTKD